MQKYRLYLKRLSAVANQQANMVAALRGRDPSYLPMGSLDGYANINSLVSSRPLSTRTTFQSNSFTGFGHGGFVPSGTAQLGCTLGNTNNSINDSGKLHGVGLSTTLQGNQQGTLIQGLPMPLDVDKLQQSKSAQEASSCLLGGFSSSGVAIGHSASSSFVTATKSPHMQQGNQLQTQSAGLGGEVSIRIPPLSSDPFDLGRCNGTWQGAVPSTPYPDNTLPMDLPFAHNDIGDNISPTVSQLGIDARNVSSSSVVMAPLTNPAVRNGGLSNVHSQARPLVANFTSLGNSNPNLMYNLSSSSSVSSIHGTRQNAGNQKLSNGLSNQKMNIPMINQTNVGALLLTHDSRSDKTAAVGQLPYKDEHSCEDTKLPGGFSSGGFGLHDLVGSPMIKPVSFSLL